MKRALFILLVFALVGCAALAPEPTPTPTLTPTNTATATSTPTTTPTATNTPRPSPTPYPLSDLVFFPQDWQVTEIDNTIPLYIDGLVQAAKVTFNDNDPLGILPAQGSTTIMLYENEAYAVAAQGTYDVFDMADAFTAGDDAQSDTTEFEGANGERITFTTRIGQPVPDIPTAVATDISAQVCRALIVISFLEWIDDPVVPGRQLVSVETKAAIMLQTIEAVNPYACD
jgi:hypothetical protein